MRLADDWTTIPHHFQPMKLYSFMSVSEQDAFWTRRYNDRKWEWLNHLHRCVPLPELFALLDHQLLFQFVQVCKSYENNINCKISPSDWLVTVPEAKHTKAKALVRAQQDFGPNSERHTRVFKNSLADYLERPDAIPSDGIATRIPIFESIMSNEQGMAPPQNGAHLPRYISVNRVKFRVRSTTQNQLGRPEGFTDEQWQAVLAVAAAQLSRN